MVKKIELIANVAIILAVLVIGFTFLKPYLLVGFPDGLTFGSKFELQNVDWAKSDQNLVLALQEGCRFCSESAPFYKRLASQAQRLKNVHLVAVLPQTPTDGKAYLDSVGVPIGEVRQASLKSMKVEGTPTLILVDAKGIVKAAWVGKLPPAKETEVLQKLAQCRDCESVSQKH